MTGEEGEREGEGDIREEERGETEATLGEGKGDE